MTAAGPYDHAPMPILTDAEREAGITSTDAARQAWRAALAGLPMGAYDRHIAEWAEDTWDQPTLLVLAGFIERARRAGR